MIILLHSSKSMKPTPSDKESLPEPQLLEKSKKIDAYLKTLSSAQIQKAMKVSASLAKKTQQLIADWTTDPKEQTPAIDAFRGDIYSGLQAPSLSQKDRQYAHSTLRVLSGLYGILRALDGIYPYRLEMAYKFPKPEFSSLYDFWGTSIAETIAKDELIINLAADEYSQTITPYHHKSNIIAPKFLTISPKTGEPTFVVVHAKIARGAFARWLITTRETDPPKLKNFTEIGYHYNKEMSTPQIPTFVCKEFKGKGLSVKLL